MNHDCMEAGGRATQRAVAEVVGSSNLSGPATKIKGYLRVTRSVYFDCANFVPPSMRTRGRESRSAYPAR
jgi:hypothetical protein